MRLSLFEHHLETNAQVLWPAAVRALFLRAGSLTLTQPDGTVHTLTSLACLFTETALTFEGAAEVWAFELSRQTLAAMTAEQRLHCIMTNDVGLEDANHVVFRLDRVEFSPAFETPKHGHKGPGIRRLYEGRIVAEIGDEVRRLDQGDAWFETGHDPVIGRNIAPHSGFVRAMVLPVALHGKSTFIPWDETEAAKPRGTLRTEYFDRIVHC